MLCLRLVVLVLNYLLEFGTVTAYADFGSPSSAEVTADAYVNSQGRRRVDAPFELGPMHHTPSQGSQVQNSNCVSETFKTCKVRNKNFLDFSDFPTIFLRRKVEIKVLVDVRVCQNVVLRTKSCPKTKPITATNALTAKKMCYLKCL